jgi:hypothetical protein
MARSEFPKIMPNPAGCESQTFTGMMNYLDIPLPRRNSFVYSGRKLAQLFFSSQEIMATRVIHAQTLSKLFSTGGREVVRVLRQLVSSSLYK